MQRHLLDSSDISSASYDEATSVLEIEFTNGTIFQYLDVPADIFNGLLSSTSPGKFFAQSIKNKFKFFKVN